MIAPTEITLAAKIPKLLVIFVLVFFTFLSSPEIWLWTFAISELNLLVCAVMRTCSSSTVIAIYFCS